MIIIVIRNLHYVYFQNKETLKRTLSVVINFVTNIIFLNKYYLHRKQRLSLLLENIAISIYNNQIYEMQIPSTWAMPYQYAGFFTDSKQ
mgnify:CR=1 FL=1